MNERIYISTNDNKCAVISYIECFCLRLHYIGQVHNSQTARDCSTFNTNRHSYLHMIGSQTTTFCLGNSSSKWWTWICRIATWKGIFRWNNNCIIAWIWTFVASFNGYRSSCHFSCIEQRTVCIVQDKLAKGQRPISGNTPLT